MHPRKPYLCTAFYALIVAALIAPTRAGAAYLVQTLAGSANQPGSSDGNGSAARFSNPVGVATASDGTIYVADAGNQTIRKISGNTVTTFAGAVGAVGSSDGLGTNARFSYPWGLAIDGTGNLFVCDSNNNTIRRITPAGQVTTFAGMPGESGASDGIGSAARFSHPSSIAIDGNGNLYVTDYSNSIIRKITPAGAVSTLAGAAGQFGFADGQGSAARFNYPDGIAVDSSGNVWVSDSNNHVIRKISPTGAVSTVAGSPQTAGAQDGTGTAARFSTPIGISIGSDNALYVVDSENYALRRVLMTGQVRTIAGGLGEPGTTDGIGTEARFVRPTAIAPTPSGTLVATDTFGQTIRSITYQKSNAVADFNEDSQSDLVLENNRTGERVIWQMNGAEISGSIGLPTFTSGWHFAGAGDFNRDGRSDIVLQNTQTGERVIWLMDTGVITGSAGLPTLPLSWQFACVGDLDGDDSADIVLQNTGTGERVVWKMNGAEIETSLGLPTMSSAWQICAVVDIDGDTQNDLVLQNVHTGERRVWVLALQSGQLSIDRTIELPTFYAGWRFAGGGYYTTDGKPNILLQNSLTGDRVLWSMNADGTIANSTALPALPIEWSFAGAATNRAPISGLHDLSGDGSSDILVTNTASGERVIWAMQNGAIAGSIGLPTLPADWRFAAIGDFNADGLNDILLENTGTGDRVLWLMNTGTIGGGAGLPALAPAWRFAAVVDVTLDGQPDIVLQNTTTGERTIWVMDRTKVDSTIALPTLPTNWNIAGAGKFTADGRANLILENTSTGDRLFWSLNPDGAIFQSIGLPTLAVSWRIAGTGDFNGDDKPDILLENTNTGDRVIWAMDHTNIATSIGLPTLPTSWSLRD
jgi:sugar lactone lactonase YvrE